MFDRITAETIRAAPNLRGVTSERLAAELTDAYVQVSVASALLEGDENDVDLDLLAKLKSVARSQETIALTTLDDPALRQAAAYVSARAYQILAFRSPATDITFTSSSIPTPVSSMLLFVASDATPDAGEMAQSLRSNGSEVESVLIDVLGSLGRSEYQVVADLQLPEFALPTSPDPHRIAAYIGYFDCLQALSAMCRALLLVDRGNWVTGRFATIRDSLRSSFAVGDDQAAVDADDTILGPWHLASLLDLAEQVLFASALTAVPAPDGVNETDWARLLEGVAKRRPILWRNHRDAVQAGFLQPGTSAVVTFPTGAGKSTITELKVAAANLSGRNVIFLVPTLSLLDQQARSLRSTLVGTRVVAQRDFEDEMAFAPTDGPTTFVLTPESCLAIFSADADSFGDVGLIVFDEAHLLAAVSDVPERRALDATLCLLMLARASPSADLFLVSAMIGNAEALRDWLAESTGREALALDDPWKPTRQARGAVVYRSADIDRLKALVLDAQTSATTDGPPVALQRQMEATPHGFFGLLTSWESRRQADYRFLPLLQQPTRLAITGKVSQSGWRLTANVNQTASEIARSGAQSGRKVLVFAQQVGWSVSVSNAINVGSQRRTQLRRVEVALLERAVEAAGSANVLYGNFEGDSIVGDSLPHHGLLLKEERRLHESIYRRADGLPVLVATSTLAQGMNLPSEIVVIAGDRRFDSESRRPERLEAQELLNAAGRAGRAGMRSNGLVVVIPSRPIAYDGARQMGRDWFELQSVFSQADQCVDVVDAITSLLGAEPTEQSAIELSYLSRRLAESADPAVSRNLISAGFGAFQARGNGTSAELERRIAGVSLAVDSHQPDWMRKAVAATGLPLEDLRHVADRLDGAFSDTADLQQWRDWTVDVFSERPSILEGILRTGSRAIFKGAPVELGVEWERLNGPLLVEAVDGLLQGWMSGLNLQELETRSVELGLSRRTTEHCEFARKFVLRVVPDLAYAFALPWLVAKRRGAEITPQFRVLRALPAAVKLGVDTNAKLDYLQESALHTRASAHRLSS